MFNANVGSSTLKDSFEAGKEAAIFAKKDSKNIKLAFMYSSVEHDQEELLKGASKILNNVPIIGNTSYTGVITPNGFITGDTFVGIMTFSGDDLAVGISGVKKSIGARETGQKAALLALKNSGKKQVPNYFYMAATPGNEELYLKGITDIIGRVPFFGGSAADNTVEGKWKVFTNDNIFSEGLSVAFFYTDNFFANNFTECYRETNNVGVITKVLKNNTLVEIDKTPAIKKYAEWISKDPSKLMGGNLLSETILTPLGVKDRLGDLVAIRHPMFGNSDFSISLGNYIATNTAVIQMECTEDDFINSIETALNDLKRRFDGEIAAFHLAHCGGGKAVIANRMDEVYEKIKKCTSSIPFIVEFTFGEYGFYEDGNNTCGGLMLSLSAFGK